MQLPCARQESLIVRELSDEVLIYDSKRDKAYCLNHTAALVWKYCDGHTTFEEITGLLGKALNTPIKDEVVWLALQQLGKSHLLRERVQQPVGMAKVSRRELVRKYLPATLVLPAIISLSAPTAFAGASCLPPGSVCGPASPPCCAPLLCTNGNCGG